MELHHDHLRCRRLLPRAILTALGLVLIVTSGCHDDSDDDETNFNAFVLNLFDDTSDTGTPVSINGVDFGFKENPNAFASLYE
jgi:hypothetical protein